MTRLLVPLLFVLTLGAAPVSRVYKTASGVDLALHIYAPDAGAEKRPAILFFFGGGWVGGTTKQFEPHALHFSARGMVAITADYRVASRNKTTPFDAVEDAKDALAWVHAHAAELGIDAARIVVGGGSAGGHLAATSVMLPPLRNRAAAMVLFNPVVDTTAAGYGAEKVKGREREASPVHNIAAGAPPAIVFHGTADTTVPFANAQAFCDGLRKVGTRCELVPYEGQQHGFFNHGRGDGKFYTDTVAKAEAFLRSLQILDPPAKKLASKNGMVAASTPFAAAAGAKMLAMGGNAVDAAAAAAFALMVTDPPMTSLGGRSQTVIALADGRVFGVDGATQAPASVTPLEDPKQLRTGYQLVPVPGNPAALAHAVVSYGKLKLAQVIEPAMRLAEDGFAVTPQVAAIWTSERKKLAANPGAAANYLKPDGSPYLAGETFRHPRLAALLRRLAAEGPESFYRGATGERIAADVSAHRGFVQLSDLAAYKPGPGQIVKADYRGYEILSMGRHGWGNTMGEMLQILSHFPVSKGAPAATDVELLARVIAQSLDDRPQFLGTLRPKPNGLPLDQLSDKKFAAQRAREIRARMGKPLASAGALAKEDHDTTHLSVIDAAGNAVALTTSIGPRFGSGVATPDLGFLYGYSYNMRSAPVAGTRDLTEMSPTIVRKNGKVILAIGAAGSERIPAAILQTMSYFLDRAYSLADALAAPRVFAAGNKARLHETFPTAVAGHLRKLGFELELRDPGVHQHLGIVHAVSFDPKTGEFQGAADPVYDGAAASPGK